MPPRGRNRVFYSALGDTCRAEVLPWAGMPGNSVAAAQWEVRGHMEECPQGITSEVQHK